jgi:membrane-bound inhibitor of C-type lysozyme
MKRKLAGVISLALCGGLAACTTPDNSQNVTQKTVEYRCGTEAVEPLTVQYTFQGAEALAAKVIYRNQAVDLTRTEATNTDMVGNTFRGNGYTWTTAPFTIDNVQSADGNMLTEDVNRALSGHNARTADVLVGACKVAA